jgi:hypothetical protein
MLEFVGDYWEMIRLAAGWDALRHWLLVRVASCAHIRQVLSNEQLFPLDIRLKSIHNGGTAGSRRLAIRGTLRSGAVDELQYGYWCKGREH